MNFKTTILLVVLLVIVGASYLLTRSTPGREEVERDRAGAIDSRGLPVFSADELSTESVTKLTIQRGDKAIVIERDGSVWRQSEPVTFPISEWQGKTLVDRAATMRYTDKFTAGKDDNPTLAEVGLDAPSAIVTLQLPENDDEPAKTHTIKFGRTIGASAYVQVNDDPQVYAVNADAHKLLVTGDVNDWRSRSLTAPSEGLTQKVTLRREDTTIELTKVDGRWMLDPARGDRADADAVKGLLSGIGSLSISEFIADAPSDSDMVMYGLDKPRLTVSVETSDKPLTIHVGGPADLRREAFFATWSQGEAATPVVFSLPQSAIERFEKPADELRDKRITIARTAEVNELTVDRGELPTAIHVVKKPEGWAFGDPAPAYAVDSDAVRELLDAVIEARATAFVPDATREAPAATIVLNLVGGKAPERLSVFKHDAEGKTQWMVLRDGERTGYVVPRDRLDPVFKPVVSLRDRQVITLAPHQVASIRVERDGETITLKRERLEGESQATKVGPWTLEGHEKVEEAAAATLLGTVAPLRAEMWLGPEAVENKLTVTVTPFEGDAITLRIDPQSRITSGPWSEGVFVVPQALVNAAKAEFRYRTVLPLKVDDIRKLTLARGDATIVVERDASGKYTRPDGQALSESDAGAMFDTLAGLRAERFRDANKIKMDQAQPVSTLTLDLSDGGRRTLALWPPSQNDLNEHVGILDQSSQAFTLKADVVERLVKLIDGNAPQPK